MRPRTERSNPVEPFGGLGRIRDSDFYFFAKNAAICWPRHAPYNHLKNSDTNEVWIHAHDFSLETAQLSEVTSRSQAVALALAMYSRHAQHFSDDGARAAHAIC